MADLAHVKQDPSPPSENGVFADLKRILAEELLVPAVASRHWRCRRGAAQGRGAESGRRRASSAAAQSTEPMLHLRSSAAAPVQSMVDRAQGASTLSVALQLGEQRLLARRAVRLERVGRHLLLPLPIDPPRPPDPDAPMTAGEKERSAAAAARERC